MITSPSIGTDIARRSAVPRTSRLEFFQSDCAQFCAHVLLVRACLTGNRKTVSYCKYRKIQT